MSKYNAEYHRAYYERNKDQMVKAAATRVDLVRIRNRKYIDQLKQHPCVDCGNEYPDQPWLMSFDHVPGRGDKVLDLSRIKAFNWSLAKIDEEIAKCDLVCLMCHANRIASRAGWGLPKS